MVTSTIMVLISMSVRSSSDVFFHSLVSGLNYYCVFDIFFILRPSDFSRWLLVLRLVLEALSPD